jgi:predicted TIM-barrel fold metal-dependent hydrolase
MLPAQLNSSDSHVVEPPDLWQTGMDADFAERAPRVVREATGDWWYADGVRLASMIGGTDIGLRFEHQEELRREARLEQVRPGAFDAVEKLKDMDREGVSGEVVYPTLALALWSVPDVAYLSAVARRYNDWIADFCRAAPGRLRGVAMIVLDDVPAAVGELERIARLDLGAAMISVYPKDDIPYDRREYDPFWAAAQDLEMPLSLHVGTNRQVPRGIAADQRAAIQAQPPSFYCTTAHWIQVSLANLIFSGVFERFPRLKVVSAEHELAWAAHFLRAMDYLYTQRARRAEWPRFRGDALPSDFFHRNVFLSFQEDALGIRLRDLIGVDNLMWGSDYPHAESTFPRSRAILTRTLARVPEEEAAKIVAGNANRVYGFGVSK